LPDVQKARKEGRVGGRPKVVVNRAKVDRLHEAGKSLSHIAAAVHASKSTVHRLLTEGRTRASTRAR
jgi:DNA invertase Pin-like site-specific DNA recombinase